MATIGLTTPWVIHYRKIEAFFKNDPDVNVIYNNNDRVVRLYVEDGAKASALDALLPDEVTFGNVTLKISVIPANGASLEIPRDIHSVAFTGNFAVNQINTVRDVTNTPIIYIVCKKEVVQIFTDDLNDYYGLSSTLYEDIARDIFTESPGIFYCTDVD